MLSLAPSVVIGDSLTVAAFAREGLRHQLDQFLVLASGRADRDPQRDRSQRVVKRAGSNAEQENARSQDQQRIVPSLPSQAAWRRIFVQV